MTDTAATLDEQLDALTPLQRRFVEFALDCGSAVEAYRKAGGTATTDESAWSAASRLLRNVQVSAALAGLKAERRRMTVADSAWIREKLVQVVNRALQAIPVLDSAGEPTGVWKCDLAAANAALRTLVLLHGKEPTPRDGQMTREEIEARLRLRGLDPEKMRSLPGGE
jgi:hypothetical protein